MRNKFCAGLLLVALNHAAFAAIINVTSTADSGPGTLRAALASSANGDTINATGVSGTILLTSGTLGVSNNITILGPGPTNLLVNANSNRAIYINPNLNVAISGITISNASVNGFGGGIYNNNSSLSVSNCAFRNSTGTFGGGLAAYANSNQVFITVRNSTFSNNRGILGGALVGYSDYITNVVLSVTDCAFTNNLGNSGSAIYNNAILSFSNCTVIGNSVLSPGDGSAGAVANTGTMTAYSSLIRSNFTDTYGAGLYNGGTLMVVSNCTVTGNTSAVRGGGIYNIRGKTLVFDSVINGNSAVYIGGAFVNEAYSPYDPQIIVQNSSVNSNSCDNLGGAFYNLAEGNPGHIAFTNCTLVGNKAQYGGAGVNDGFGSGNAQCAVISSTVSSNSAAELGGAFYNIDQENGNAVLTILNSTLSGNSSTNTSGAIHHTSQTGIGLYLGSTILQRGASGANLYYENNFAVSLGYNLSSDNGSGALTATGDQTNTNPQLGPLQNNGGATLTHALLSSSPAIDKGKNFAGLSTDQRGSARPADLCIANATGGDGTDIGAFEFALAPTYTVVNRNDSGAGSLRDALTAANICSDSNTITFAPSAYGTITLSSELPISGSVSIIGPGAANVTLNGNAVSRIFSIASGLNVTLSGLTLTNGANTFGGAVYNDHSTLTVSNCALSGNSATYGGAIYNSGNFAPSAALAIIGSTLSRNSASDEGGAIYNDGEFGSATLTVLNSTFSTNSAVGGGGAIWNTGTIGNALLTVSACTFSGNRCNNTIAAGGIYNNGSSGTATLQIGNTIFVAGTSGANLENSDGTITSFGYNLSSDNGSGFLNGTADQINTNPLLGPLQYNGGPTFTHALLTGSPALDKGKRNAVASLPANTDQRGVLRPDDSASIPNASGGDGSDIGAFEYFTPAIYTVINRNDSGAGSLRQAILDSAVFPDTNVIVFAPSAYGAITLTSGELVIDSPLSIIGPGATNVAINGNASSRGFYVAPGLNITIAGLAIGNGTNLYGGGIYNDHATLSVSNCVITGCKAFFGGGIFNSALFGSGTLFVSGCMFSGNAASDEGGALYNEEGGTAFMSVLNSTFSTNTATTGGGAIWNAGALGQATLVVSACTFSGNRGNNPGGYAGAIHNDGAGIVQIGNTLLNAGASGKNLVSDSSTITSFGYNLSSDDGSGLLNQTTDQININPLLGPLQFNGGPTPTHALLTGSPAIDKGKRNAVASLPANTDQRGIMRPIDAASIANASGGDGSDIGAFEAPLPLPITPVYVASPQKLPNGSFQLSFTNTPGSSFTVLMSTNVGSPLSSWTVLGAPMEISAGNFQFTDAQATNRPQSFYTIRSP